ncbi:MAG TPA: GNAT family N-acetyltransferase [Vicinamibacterales bacterium]|nr:GNAT family N-acetyltransferase [Vicinamibacterales bacterium]
MDIRLREARSGDIEFARALYLETMRGLIEPLFGWDQPRQESELRELVRPQPASIITVDGRDVGWMQIRTSKSELFLGSLYVVPEMQRRGIGTHVLRELIAESQRASKALTLAVMKNNPAVRLYERLGFRLTHEDEYKFYMRLGNSPMTQ